MANACQITGPIVRARGDDMSDYGTGILLATFPELCPWAIDRVLDEDFWPEA